MAVSTRDLHGLLTRVENDNAPLPSETRPAGRRLLNMRPVENRFDIDLPCLSTRLEAETGILWARMKHPERACYTPELMQDMRDLQNYLHEQLAGVPTNEMPVRYLVWTSQAPKAWSLGGDLTNFTAMIRNRDEAGLRAYAHTAIDILYDNYSCMELPIITIALVAGDAVGGGFEAMLTDDVVIAERQSKFGLPEILFNLFPGMGAYSFLKRRVGEVMARRLIEDGQTRSADEMKEIGLVDEVCETGDAEAALRRFVAETEPRFNTVRTLRQVRRRVDPVGKRELMDVVDMWVDLAMGLSDTDLRRMDCLARVQEKKRGNAA